MKIAQEELLKSRKKNKTLYDQRAKRRGFQEGDKVLLLLPTDTNKLLMQWKGLYETVGRCGKGNDYRIEVNKKVRKFHANMVKQYIEKADQDGAPQQNTDDNELMSCGVCTGIIGGNENLSVNDEEMMELANCHQKETVQNVRLGVELTKTQQKEMMNTLSRHEEDFSDTPGKTNMIKHKIELTENLKKEIDDMLSLGIIRESSSPFASPIVIVKKKDGSDRIRVDYRKLNKLTVADPEPMTPAEDLFQRLGKSKYYSKIDLSKEYWQIPVAEKDIEKIAFVTPDGTYDFLRMPFEIKNSGATTVRGMRKILAGMSNVNSYIDDLIIHTNDNKYATKILYLYIYRKMSSLTHLLINNAQLKWLQLRS